MRIARRKPKGDNTAESPCEILEQCDMASPPTTRFPTPVERPLMMHGVKDSKSVSQKPKKHFMWLYFPPFPELEV
jgi:hypothetical protein